MTSQKITLAIFSSTGRQRLQVERTCRASTLKIKIRDLLRLEEDFKVLRDNGKGRPGTDQIKLIGTTTILSLGLKSGDVVHVFPLSGTRFQEVQEITHQNGTVSSSNHKRNVTEMNIDASNSSSLSNQGKKFNQINIDISLNSNGFYLR